MTTSPPSGPVAYSYLPRLGGSGVRLELVPGALAWSIGAREGRLALADITSVQLRFLPAKFAAPSFQMEISGRDGTRLKAGSASRISLTGVRDQKEDYAAFVRALHRALAAAGGTPRYSGGFGVVRFWMMVAAGTAALAGLLAVLGFAMARQEWSFALFLLAMGAFVVWPTAEMIWRNRPVTYTLEVLPRHLLPA